MKSFSAELETNTAKNQSVMNSVGVDIGGSHIAACSYDLDKNRLLETDLVYRKVNSKGSKNQIITEWVSAISACIATSEEPIEKVGIAMPGPFDYYNGISLIKDVDKLSSLLQVNIRLELAEKLRLQPSNIRFINDATAFSIAEAQVGSARNYDRVVAITLGTGLGASFLIDHNPILRDKIVPEGGFLYNQFFRNELADDLFSTRGILRLYETQTGKRIENVRALNENATNGDLEAKECFHSFGTQLGIFLKPYLTEFQGEVLVIGGNISKAYEHFGKALSSELPDLKISVSNLGEKAAIIGSALLANESYYKNIKPTLKLM